MLEVMIEGLLSVLELRLGVVLGVLLFMLELHHLVLLLPMTDQYGVPLMLSFYVIFLSQFMKMIL